MNKEMPKPSLPVEHATATCLRKVAKTSCMGSSALVGTSAKVHYEQKSTCKECRRYTDKYH